MKKNFTYYAALALPMTAFAVIILPFAAHAASAATASSYTLLAPLPNLSGTTAQITNTVTISTYVQYMFNLLIGIGAVASVFMITWGGFEYMTTDAVSGKTEGVNKIKNAIYGLLLILCSYLILQTIDPRFVNIPSGLVAPLNLNSNANGLNSFNMPADTSTAAGNEINALNASQADTRDALSSSNDQLNQINGQTGSIASQITAITGDDPDTSCSIDTLDDTYDNTQLDSLCGQYYSSQSSANAQQGTSTLILAEGTIDNDVGTCGTTGDDACYSTETQAIASTYAQYSGQLQPDQVSTLQSYASAAQATLAMDKYVSDYNANLAAYNMDEFGSGGTVNGFASSLMRYTWGAASGVNSSNYANIQLAQTNALSGIESTLQQAQSSVTDQTMYQQLSTQATTLENEVQSEVPASP
jgi:Type IV secretion system pilin